MSQKRIGAKEKAKFIRLLEKCSKKPIDTFRDFCEIGALCIHQLPYLTRDLPIVEDDCQRIERAYLAKAGELDPEDMKRFQEMLAITQVALDKYEFALDFLGDIFHEISANKTSRGQFFSSFEEGYLQGRLHAQSVAPILEEKPLITVADHFSGSGVQFLAFAKALAEQGVDPRGRVIFDAIDIDRTCFNMTFLQLAASGLMANVHWGDTMKMEIWEHRETWQLKLFNQWALCKFLETEVGQLEELLNQLLEEIPEEAADSGYRPTDPTQMSLPI